MSKTTKTVLGILLFFILCIMSGCGIPDMPGPIGIPGV